MATNILCAVCCETVKHRSRDTGSAYWQACEKLFTVFCHYMELEEDKAGFDFHKEPFPFCELCKVHLGGILKVHELVESLRQQIKGQVCSLTVKLLESKCPADETKSGNIYEDPKRKVKFRKKSSIRSGKHVDVIEVSSSSPTSMVESVMRKISRLRRTIRNRYDVRVEVNKVPSSYRTTSNDPSGNVKVTRQKLVVSKTERASSHTVEDVSNDQGVPADLDFSDVPMDDDFVFDQEEFDSVVDESKATSPMKELTTDYLSIGMEVEVDESPAETATAPVKVEGADSASSTHPNVEEPYQVPEPPEPPPMKEVNNTKFIMTPLYSTKEISPGVFQYADQFSFRMNDDGSYKCDNCSYHCPRRAEILRHMRNKHALDRHVDAPAALSDEPTPMHQKAVARFYPLNMNRSVQIAPGKFIYARKYHFEMRGDNFRCETCGEVAATKARMLRHVRYVHFFAGRYKCSKCEAAFSELGKLKLHLEQHSETPLYMCDVCGKSFKGLKVYQQHKNTVHKDGEEKKEFMCDQCGKTFASQAAVKAHVIWHESLVACPTCGEEFPDRRAMVHHRAATHLKEQRTCSQCGLEFPSEQKLACHVASSHPPEEEVSSIAIENATETTTQEASQEAAASEAQVEPALTVVSDPYEVLTGVVNTPEGVTCPICSKRLKKRKYLIDHVRTQHGEMKNEFRCKICGKEAQKKSNVRSHIKHAHGAQYLTPNDDFVEDLRDTVSLSKKKRKMRGNRGEGKRRYKFELQHDEDGKPKGFQCSKCSAVFKKKVYLNDHMDWIHEARLRFKCDICDLAMRKRYEYRQHMEKEHGIIEEEVPAGRKRKAPEDGDDENSNDSEDSDRNPNGDKVEDPTYTVSSSKKKRKVRGNRGERNRRYKFELERDEDGKPTGFQCSKCSAVFKKKVYLNDHMDWIHEARLRFKCDICDVAMRKRYQYRQHMEKVHGVVEEDGSAEPKLEAPEDIEDSNDSEDSDSDN